MKKKILLFVFAIVFTIGVSACGGNTNTEIEKEEISTEKVDHADYMVQHIKSIKPENRDEFLSFWQTSVSYCKTIALELKNSGNTNSYEFDPTDASQIPEEISGLYDFSRLTKKNSENLHKNFVMKINGTEVSLSYDGIDIFPTKYAYSDIQDIIDSMK